MYMRKIMVCNVTTFSYNRGPSGGALYLGNIGSPKDRCVSDTCEENCGSCEDFRRGTDEVRRFAVQLNH